MVVGLISLSNMPLTVRNRGLVILSHRDSLLHWRSSQSCGPQVIKEPVVNEVTVATGDPGLRLDLGIRGIWQPQVEALYDVSVSYAPSRALYANS